MKKILFVLIISVCLFGCDNFLTRFPEDQLTSDNFYTSLADYNKGLTGCYKTLQAIYNDADITGYGEIMSDDTREPGLGAWADPFKMFLKTNGNSISGIWTNDYKLIYNCNAFLENLAKFSPKNAVETAEAKAMEGEAHFLRGLAYFNLVRFYGDVPMVTKTFSSPGESYGLGRTPVAKVYSDVIIPDINIAVAQCYQKGAAQLKGQDARATSGTALYYLAKAYLQQGDFPNAQTALKKMIEDKQGGTFSLMTTYADVFDVSKKYNVESILEAGFSIAAGQPSNFYAHLGPDISTVMNVRNIVTGPAVYGSCNLLSDFSASGEKDRFAATVDSGKVSYAVPPLQPFRQKFAPKSADYVKYLNTKTDYNYMIARYADALLMYAECMWKAGNNTGALQYINQVRTRAKMAALPANTTIDIDLILHERRMELTFEGQRFFDLVRTGKAISVLSKFLRTKVGYDSPPVNNADIVPEQLLLPIPVSEIQKDPTLIQNPGY